jgi:hypothetical protein
MSDESKQLQHDTGVAGGLPCRRCGLRHTGPKTAYIACFREGDNWQSWYDRLNEGERQVVDEQRGE